MKLSQKPAKSKRVFVNIRERPKPAISHSTAQPKPPTHPNPQFIRKKPENFRSHTPEQIPYRPVSIQHTNPPSRRSLSPFIAPQSNKSSYFLPREPESLLSIELLEKDDIQCLPYELDTILYKPPTNTNFKSVKKSNSKHIDLTPGIFSEKQIVNDSKVLKKNEKNESLKFFASAGFVHADECTTVASRTPSPIVQQRNSRCKALSTHFKINKQIFVGDAGIKGPESGCDGLGMWSDLNGIESTVQKRDFSPQVISRDRPRVPIKLIRGQ